MWKKYTNLIIILSVILIILQHLSLLSISNRQIHSELSYLNHLGFSTDEYEQAKLEEDELKNEYDLTAVLLHWKRSNGVRRTLRYLLRTNFFKQIIIWNNNPHINLTRHHFHIKNHREKFVHIINSKKNLKDEAKYRACTFAKTRACFYVDDDWDISRYLKSLIASFRSDPYLLHAVTDPYTFYTNLVWSYFDPRIDLHTGFSWIGCGSIFLRQHAQKHIQLIHTFIKNHSRLIHLSDVFFSIWLNDIPVQINTDIQSHPSRTSLEPLPFASTPDFSTLQYRSSILAIRILERTLRSNLTKKHSNITFSRQENRRFPYCVKSSSFNDDFVFYTNVLPFQLQNISFDISQDYDRGTRMNLPNDPNAKYFSLHSTLKTTDDDLSTCWYASREIRSNDFFAIDFLYIQKNVKFILAVAHSPRLQKKLDISISFDGLRWLSYQSQNGIYTKKNRTSEEHLHTFLFDSAKFQPGFTSFRYISFKAIEDYDHHFQVCEIQIISKKNLNIIKHDFHQLNVLSSVRMS